jgi:NAD(P)H dehydrogenase (quinone)
MPSRMSQGPSHGVHAVIACHPDDDSFTMSVARAYCAAVTGNGQEAVLRDLYRIGFDPVLKAEERGAEARPAPDVQGELDAIGGADVFVLVYPVWFATPPAMLKGYIERVFGAGFTEPLVGKHLRRATHPLLGGRKLLGITASGSSTVWLEEQGFGAALQVSFESYLARVFWMDTPAHLHFDSIVEGTPRERIDACLAEVAAQTAAMCERLARR